MKPKGQVEAGDVKRVRRSILSKPLTVQTVYTSPAAGV